MKLVLITNLYEPYARGGAEVIVKRTALELLKLGHDVSIITAKPWSGLSSLKPEKEEMNNGIKMIRYYPLNIFFYRNDGNWPLFFRFIWHFFDLVNVVSAITVKKILLSEKPDLILTHNLIGLGFLLPKVIKQTKIKHIHVLHDIQLAIRSGVMKQGEEQAWFVSGFIARMYQGIVKALFGSPDICISPSKFLRDFYEKLGYFPDSQKEVIQNPIDQLFFEGQQSKNRAGTEGNTSFGYIGQLVEHKGLKTLLKAFLSITDPSIRLEIVGSGAMEEEIKDCANKDTRITFHGRIPNEELPAFYQSIDVTLVPTETYENSPTVVFESLASGKPVIVSSIGGAAEMIDEGKNGFVFKPGDSKELSEKIRDIIKVQEKMQDYCLRLAGELEKREYAKRILSI